MPPHCDGALRPQPSTSAHAGNYARGHIEKELLVRVVLGAYSLVRWPPHLRCTTTQTLQLERPISAMPTGQPGEDCVGSRR
eukprot:scaffold221251_cov32-Tisochrysis_lutea.AAC.2